jgi:hypothetical protein
LLLSRSGSTTKYLVDLLMLPGRIVENTCKMMMLLYFQVSNAHKFMPKNPEFALFVGEDYFVVFW